MAVFKNFKDDEYYASKDDVYAEMLKRYKSL